MKLKLTLEDVQTGETEEVIVGMVIAKRWETQHGEAVTKALEERPPTVLVELAHLGYVRKHGRPGLSIEEFEDRFDVEVAEKVETPEVPSDPATAPSSD